jgi:HAD superfamily hydrolase (TIGR01509 family)
MKAIIFDLDGVLVSTNIIHRDSLISAIQIVTGIDTTGRPEVSEHSMASTAEKIRLIQSVFQFHIDACHTILTLKDNIFYDKIKNLTAPTNVIECLEYIISKNIKTAIASNSRLMNMNHILDITNLRKYFDTIVSCEDVPNRKPAPDMLFEIYKRLNVDGKNTLFIDDTDEGAAAGYNSLSTVIKINSPADLTLDLFKKWIE